MIDNIRNRKMWTQEYLASQGEIPTRSLSRVKGLQNAPILNSLENYMNTMEMPIDTFFYPYTNNLPIDFIQVRNAFLYHMEWIDESPNALNNARILLKQIYTMGDFSEGLNKQLFLCCQTRLDLATGNDYRDIIKTAKEAISITYPEFDQETFDGDILLLEEPNLVHHMAIAYAKDGNISKAITLLDRLQAGLSRLPQDDRIKEKLLSSILLDESQLLIDNGEYVHALDICDKGFKSTIRRNRGKHCPDFMYTKAQILLHQGNKDEAAKLLKQVYFGFTALRKKNKAAQVLEYIRDIGHSIETYGTQHLPGDIPDFTLNLGKRVTCKTKGELLKFFRNEAGISIRELAKGICDYTILNKIENDKVQGHVFNLESIMERLGRDIDLHINTFLSHSDFKEKQLRDEIRLQLHEKNYVTVEAMIQEFKSTKSYAKYNANVQTIAITEAGLHKARNGFDETYLEMLKDAWKITKDPFSVEKILKIRMSHNELAIANRIAIHLCANNEKSAGLALYKNLLSNMEHYFVDESERLHLYPTILFNYTHELNAQGDYQNSLSKAIKGEELCIKHLDFERLPGFQVYRGAAFLEQGDKEKGTPYLATAYYASALLGQTDDQEDIKKYAKERLDIDLD